MVINSAALSAKLICRNAYLLYFSEKLPKEECPECHKASFSLYFFIGVVFKIFYDSFINFV